MDFEQGPDERAATEKAAAFVAEVLSTLPADPPEFLRRATSALGERGFLGETSMVRTVLAVAEMSRASGSLGIILSHAWLFAEALDRFGGPPSLVESARHGTSLGCVAFLEMTHAPPGDRIHAERGGALTGTLPLVLGGGLAEHAVVLCRDPHGANPRWMLVELGGDAVRRSARSSALGLLRAPRASLDFTALPASACVVLAEGEGAIAANRSLVDAQRILTAGVALGLSRRARDAAKAHVTALGRRASQSAEFLVSDMITSFDAAWVSAMHASWLRDAGTGHTVESAAAKFIAARAATKITHDAIGVCGESTDDEHLKRAYLDACVLEMHAGTEAMQVDTMASAMLGEF